MSLGDDSKRLADLIDSVADGRSIDWGALDDAPMDDGLRRLVAMLRMVSDVAEVHRSEPGPVGDTPPLDAPTPEPAGTEGDAGLGHWGHFQLLRKIGEGSFGEVYHARDSWLDHSVALKLIKPHLVDRTRFLHEARTLAHIRHPNVVAIHGADQHEGRLGFWMDLIEGHTLADVLEHEGVRTAHEAALIGQDLCRALAAVHATKIVHRDIKAQNVIRQSETGRIVLMDFGAGEAMEPERSGHRPRGTPLYLAPELFDGSIATKESDIYALGVLLFNLVTRVYPVSGASVEQLVLAHRVNARVHLGDLRPDLPDAFVRVVETMVAPDPAQRYHSATDVRVALEELVGPSRGAREGSATVQHLYRWAGWTALAVATLTLIGAVSSLVFNAVFGLGGFTSESPIPWFRFGWQTLLAPVIRITLYSIVFVAVVGALRVLCRLLPLVGRATASAQAACRVFLVRRELHDPALLLQVIAGLTALALGLLAFWRWSDATIFAVDVASATPDRLAALQPANEPRYDVFQRLLELILFAYGLFSFLVYRSARRSAARIPPAITAYVIAVPAVAILLMRAMPYRVVYANEFRRVDYGTSRCYQMGEKPGWVRLFCPDEDPPRVRDYKEDDRLLRDRNVSERVFTPRGQARVFAITPQ